ncbi:uncharacterized protein SPAPADRAFT_63589 [Spathaspora passalidarum NRRL Y-27907]|uniref:Uncharacterized protein n=1 Tax=Spathaspora passalidarum (strain NRRL Y-27907 / 11-Y1) TaxID=619300 RepID=G3AVL8_SPAPN|nr:uncharacterized protein SPAPADRAFT_63589 [Spathaspora passalidarum NRRL Y-27907]EGW29967.1 hypothetical protein SPAPADRAFT_63589 [Spathaspora passalidarum NRRL Y-27907]
MSGQKRSHGATMLVGSPFPHPWCTDFGLFSARSLDDWLIMEISQSLRSKNEWQRKYKDETIASKWKQEIRDQCKNKTNYMEEVIDYVFKELEWYEELESTLMESSGFEIGCNEYMAISNSVITWEVKEDLKARVLPLVESFGEALDYHPGSDNKVIDLVHPSLFPLQYDITPVFGKDNKLEIVKYTEEIQHAKINVFNHAVSKKFQWIPALLKLQDNGKFTFSSYINNLHPVKHKELYSSIEDVFNAIIPGLNYTLSRYASKEHLRVRVPPGEDAYTEELDEEKDAIYDRIDEMDQDKEEEIEALYDQISDLEKDKSRFVLKTIRPNWEENHPVLDQIIDVRTFGSLKVIVKLANIELTPENPSYNGGSWHVEGTINEDIVATVLYYYDMDNISESKLSFRTDYSQPNYAQHDAFYLEHFYGLKDSDLMMKNIGSIEAKENKVVIFPNMYQHHVDSFELKDKTKSGHRKILCFFITDPYNSNVVSSDRIPPQQKEWWDDEQLSYLYPDNTKQEILQLKSESNQEWPLTLNYARPVREELMKERSIPQDVENDFDRHFCFCEH